MRTYQIVFSPTGGTEKVAALFTQALCPHSTKIDLTNRTLDFSGFRFTEKDVCVVAVPSYSGRVPAPAAGRIACMQGNGARAILMAVYGNRAIEDTLVELADILTAAGFVCVAGVAAVAEHSMLRQFAAGRPDETDAAQLAGFARQVSRALADPGFVPGPSLPGNRPYRKVGPRNTAPLAGAECVGCGTCAALCPVGAIPPQAPSHTDTTLCISCMRCVAVCPQQARHVQASVLAASAQRLEKACAGRKPNELFL